MLQLAPKPTVEGNIALAKAIALKYLSRNEQLEDSDVYSFALQGLWMAVKEYRPEKGKFSTYAYPCIQHAILRGLQEANPVRAIKRKNELVEDEVTSCDRGDAKHRLVEQILNLDENDSPRVVESKRLLRLHYLECRKQKELAKEFGVSKQAINQKLARALKLMRKMHESGHSI